MSKLIIGLDLSTKTGYAVLKDGKPLRYGTLWPETTTKDLLYTGLYYPINYIRLAEMAADRIWKEVLEPCAAEVGATNLLVVIEETTASQQNYSQKKLEFTHYAVNKMLREKSIQPFYVRDGVWKNKVGARQNDEERRHNEKVSRNKKKTGKKIAMLPEEPGGKPKRTRPFDAKDYVMRCARERYGIIFSDEQEDAADALLLATAFMMGVPLCDGTPEGGVEQKTGEIKKPKKKEKATE